MKQLLSDLLTSKKFVASVAGVLVALAARVGLDLPEETVALLIAPIVSYVLAQGWTDRGKEAAKIQMATIPLLESKAPPVQNVTIVEGDSTTKERT